MKRLAALSMILLLLLLCACSTTVSQHESDFNIACTTYPVYLLANTIAGQAEGVTVTLVIDQQVSCLHDYALTVSDMKVLEGADVVLINGAGLEDFLEDALENHTVIDCSDGISLLDLPQEHEAGHSHSDLQEELDPHIWMDPRRYAQMAQTIASALAQLDQDHSELYLSQGEACAQELELFYASMLESPAGKTVSGCEIITFHDGFSYFAEAFELQIAAAIEEEEGAEASAQDLKEMISIVTEHRLPAVFTEVNGSSSAAGIIAQECGVRTAVLSMVMSGPLDGTISEYEAALTQNIQIISEEYQ